MRLRKSYGVFSDSRAKNQPILPTIPEKNKAFQLNISIYTFRTGAPGLHPYRLSEVWNSQRLWQQLIPLPNVL